MGDLNSNVRDSDEEQGQDGQQAQSLGDGGESNFSDGSEALFSMYLRRASEEDRKMADGWKGYADGMLVFTGLFSAAVAALLAVTVQDIRPSSQDTSNFYLARIHQQLSRQLNESQDPIPMSLSNNPAQSFSAPTSAIWVNGFWFLSLVISLTCALMATLLQQWARRYLEAAYPPYSPSKRARIRAFYSEGVDECHVSWTVEALPTLLHISLFLFFAGLAVFLFNVHLTIFGVVTTWIAICLIMYACVTFLPIIRKNSPYSGPLSTFFSFCVTGTRHVFFKLFEKFRRNRGSVIRPVRLFSLNMYKTAEDYARRLHHDIDYRALLWTFKSLDQDGELQEFFEGLLGLCSSRAVPNALRDFINPNARMLSNELVELMNRTLSSNLVSESVKQSRITICTKVIGMTHLIGDWRFLRRVLLEDWHRFLRCVEFGIFAQKLENNPGRVTALFAQCSAAAVISNVQERDENWYQLVSGQLNIPKTLLYRYLSHGDSILLANLMFIIRRIVQAYSGSSEHQQRDLLRATSKTLKFVCKFDVRHAVPELQHDFCDLWNLLADKAENDERPRVKCITKAVLEHTRKLYDALHPGTNDATPYPRCTCPEHPPFSPVEELQFDAPPLEPSPNPAHKPGPSATAIPSSSSFPLSSSSTGRPLLSIQLPSPSPPLPSLLPSPGPPSPIHPSNIQARGFEVMIRDPDPISSDDVEKFGVVT